MKQTTCTKNELSVMVFFNGKCIYNESVKSILCHKNCGCDLHIIQIRDSAEIEIVFDGDEYDFFSVN